MTTQGTPRTIRFGILCNDLELQAWQARCLDALIQVPSCVPVVAVVNASPRIHRGLWRRLADSFSAGGFSWSVFDRLIASKPTTVTRSAPPRDWLRDLPRMDCRVTRRGQFSEYFDDKDVEQLRAMNLDFLVKFGFGITRGAILNVARFGVWSFHHGDESRYRGAPPCFWEIYRSDSVTGAILQRLTEELDGGVVLKRGYFETIRHSYVKNRDQAYMGSAVWPAHVCHDILNGEASYLHEPPAAVRGPIYRYPRNLQMGAFAFRLAKHWVKRKMEDLLFCDIWNIGIVNEPVESIARRGSVGNIHWLTPPGGDRYLADPSGITIGGKSWILAEDYSYLAGRGVIAARPLAREASTSVWKTVLESPHHLSYPQVFEHEERFYCLPECAESGEITLYSTNSFPEDWVRTATLVPNFPGVDSTLCFHESLWWLFCTDLKHGDRSHLHLFFSAALTGPFTAHCNNPVKIDIRGSRPAGPLFRLDGAWIRPAQNDSETYGGSIVLNRIVRLTRHAFQEEAVAELLPDPNGPFPCGLHTIHGLGSITLVDGKRRSFVPRVVLRRAIDKATRMMASHVANPVRRS
jgi:hypothetical protein